MGDGKTFVCQKCGGFGQRTYCEACEAWTAIAHREGSAPVVPRPSVTPAASAPVGRPDVEVRTRGTTPLVSAIRGFGWFGCGIGVLLVVGSIVGAGDDGGNGNRFVLLALGLGASLQGLLLLGVAEGLISLRASALFAAERWHADRADDRSRPDHRPMIEASGPHAMPMAIGTEGRSGTTASTAGEVSATRCPHCRMIVAHGAVVCPHCQEAI